jgi:hypothetical protein
MFSLRRVVRGLCLLPLLLLTGCGGPPSASGRVTLDGRPIEFGTILFVPVPGTKGAAVAGNIVNGQFEIPSNRSFGLGKYQVQISAPKMAAPAGNQPTRKGPPGVDSEWSKGADETIPERYNKDTVLEQVFGPGKNQFDFSLTSGQ